MGNTGQRAQAVCGIRPEEGSADKGSNLNFPRNNTLVQTAILPFDLCWPIHSITNSTGPNPVLTVFRSPLFKKKSGFYSGSQSDFFVNRGRARSALWLVFGCQGRGRGGARVLRCRPARPPHRKRKEKRKAAEYRTRRPTPRSFTGTLYVLIGRLPLFRCFFCFPPLGSPRRFALAHWGCRRDPHFAPPPPRGGGFCAADCRDPRCEYQTNQWRARSALWLVFGCYGGGWVPGLLRFRPAPLSLPPPCGQTRF